MVRAGAFAVIAVLGLSREPGCSGVDDPQGGKNAPCTRDSDCRSGLECKEGVCADTTTTTTPTTDGGASTDASNGGG